MINPQRSATPLVDFEALLTPIPGTNPRGISWPVDVHRRLEELRKGTYRIDPGKTGHMREEAWQAILKLTRQALRHTSKDLFLAARLTEALVHLHGFRGLCDGLQLIWKLMDRFTRYLNPTGVVAIDAFMAFRWICDVGSGANLPTLLRQIPLFHAQGKSYAFADWKHLLATQRPSHGVDYSLVETPNRELEDLARVIHQCMKELDRLETELERYAIQFNPRILNKLSYSLLDCKSLIASAMAAGPPTDGNSEQRDHRAGDEDAEIVRDDSPRCRIVALEGVLDPILTELSRSVFAAVENARAVLPHALQHDPSLRAKEYSAVLDALERETRRFDMGGVDRVNLLETSLRKIEDILRALQLSLQMAESLGTPDRETPATDRGINRTQNSGPEAASGDADLESTNFHLSMGHDKCGSQVYETRSTFHDNVQFTVYRPKVVTPNKWYYMLAFAHLDALPEDAGPSEADPVEEVKRQAQHFLGAHAEAYNETTKDSRSAVPHNAEITFVPRADGIIFNPPRRTFLFLENVHREDFRLRAAPDMVGRVAKGRLEAYLGNILLADVPINIPVELTSRVPPIQELKESSSARAYRKIFMSYSHKDLGIVDEVERYAGSLGDTFVRYWVHLRAGEAWCDRLLGMIEEADVFQLFWSRNSMHSPHVEREWRHALSLRRSHFVRPTFWEDPFPEEPPEKPPLELLAIQFHRLNVRVPPKEDTQQPTSKPTTKGTSLTPADGPEAEQFAAGNDPFTFEVDAGSELSNGNSAQSTPDPVDTTSSDCPPITHGDVAAVFGAGPTKAIDPLVLEYSTYLRVDQQADRFDAAWRRSHPPPRIRDFIEFVPADRKPSLLRELIKLDMEYRHKAGEPQAINEYLSEFSSELGDTLDTFREELGSYEFGLMSAKVASAKVEKAPKFIGKYQVVRELDCGGQGIVYRGIHPQLQRDVVIKWSKHPILPTDGERDRIRAEGRILAELDDSRIARVYDFDFHEDRPFLVLEYIRGRNLDQHAKHNKPSPREAALLVARISRAIAVAHRRGIIHQDLKPKNILMDEDGEPRVIDFGLARLRHGWTDDTAPSGGTVAFMPPEQARGETERIHPHTDIFALGAILYDLLVGKPPFPGKSLTDSLNKARACDFDRAALSAARVPPQIEEACLRAMAGEPKDRFATADEMADTLERAARPPRRWPWLAAGAAILLLVLGTTAWVYEWWPFTT